MIRLASLFWLALVCATGFATFKVKYAVQDIEEEMNRVRKQAVVEHQEIHLLRAEWTTLNQPERLADLNRRFLSLAAMAPKQLQRTVEDVPLRPEPAPPDTLIAAAPDVPAVSEPAVPQLAASEASPARPEKPLAAIAAALMPVKPAAAAQLAVSGAQSRLPENPVAATPAALKSAPVKPAAAVQLVKNGTPRPAQSIDRLFAAIAEGR
jgi:cell division protein FtsL